VKNIAQRIRGEKHCTQNRGEEHCTKQVGVKNTAQRIRRKTLYKE
jgi:hypothetical protein